MVLAKNTLQVLGEKPDRRTGPDGAVPWDTGGTLGRKKCQLSTTQGKNITILTHCF